MPPKSLKERLEAIADGERPYHKTERDCHENGCSYSGDCEDHRALYEGLMAIAQALQEQADEMRDELADCQCGNISSDFVNAKARRLAPRRGKEST
jgi:hypothetical protein